MIQRFVIVLLSVLLLAGIATADTGTRVIDFVHYTNGTVQVISPNMGIQGTGFQTLGIMWKKFPVIYFVNPSNKYGLGERQVIREVKESFATWDDATGTNLFLYGGTKAKAVFDRDGKNMVFWGKMLQSNVIAKTRVWYNPRTNAILESDMKLNKNLRGGIDPDGEAASAFVNAFDLNDIVTHEAGHVCGLADLYQSTWKDQTMYGYSSIGETKKISLESGDIAGVRYLYGG